MRRIAVLYLIWLIVFSCTGCVTDAEGEIKPYEITTVTDAVTYPGEIVYPELVGTGDFVEPINLLIRQAANEQLNELLSGAASDAHIEIGHTVTMHDETQLCVLFEGTLNDPNAAHPTNVAFALHISVSEQTLFDPSSRISLDETFLQAFWQQLSVGDTQDRFSPDEWNMVVAYIEDFADSDILETLQKEPQKTLAMGTDGVIVMFPVPHAIGDYVKIVVPYPT